MRASADVGKRFSRARSSARDGAVDAIFGILILRGWNGVDNRRIRRIVG